MSKIKGQDEYYMVWVMGNSHPSVIHKIESEAAKECERLCIKESKPCYLFKAVQVCIPPKPVPPKLKWMNL